MTLTDLQQLLFQDHAGGFAAFRNFFFAALDTRRFTECEAALALLSNATDGALQQAAQHYRAVLLSEQRQFDQAEQILRALLEEVLTHQQRARTLLELANQLDELGQWAAAQPLFKEALAYYARLRDHSGQAKVYNNLAISLCFQVEQGVIDTKRLHEALSYHQTALSLIELLDTPMEILRNWHGLGRVYGLMAQYTDAEQAFMHQLEMSQVQGDEYSEGVGLADLATLVYLPQARFADAERALRQAVTLLKKQSDDLHLAEALTRLGNLYACQQEGDKAFVAYNEALQTTESLRNRLTAPVAKADYRATTEFIYHAPLTLYLQQRKAINALTLAERARARVLADLLAGQAPTPHRVDVAELEQQRKTIRQALEQAYADDVESETLQQLEHALGELDRQIDLLDPDFAGLASVTALDADQMQTALPNNSALLMYVNDAQDHLWCLCLTKTTVQVVALPSLKSRWLQTMINEYLEGTRPGLIPDTYNRLAPLHFFPQLYKTLIAPVWPYLQAVQTVYLIPSGPLHYLPLAALIPDLNTPPPLLASGRRVVYAPSATVLFNYCRMQPPSPHQGILAVAPDDKTLQFIQGAAQTIATVPGSDTLVGAEATQSALIAHAGNHRILCFLGHAVFHRRYPMLSHIKLSDGRLQASEILRTLRIQADLVVLAACESGRGQILRGDEILGISRAMLYAGAPALIVTLWPVHEVPTRLLVEHFFHILNLDNTNVTFDPAAALVNAQAWLRTLSYAEAQQLLAQWQELTLTEAETQLRQLWQLTQGDAAPDANSRLFEHPFFWSPYILIGEPPRPSGNR